MEKKRMVCEEGPLRIFFVIFILFLCMADSRKHPPPHHCDETISQGTAALHTTTASPVDCATPPETIPKTTNTFVTDSAGTLNATTNATDSPDSFTSPNGTETRPSEPECLQGWAIFLICLGAVVTVFLLAGIPMMIYCILRDRWLTSQTCPVRYNCKIYTAPEEQAFQLE